MRVVLDNCVPRTLLRHLPDINVVAVRDHGWASVDDGPLLALLEAVCDVFVTVDQNLSHQQQLDQRPFGTIVLHARTNRLSDLIPLVPKLLVTLPTIRPGQIAYLSV